MSILQVIEADKTSLSQRRRIEELEAQLQEAKDIARDLKEELNEVQAKLEKAKENQALALDEKNLESDITTHGNGIYPRNDQAQVLHEQNLEGDNTKHENGLYSSKSIFCQPNSQLEPVRNSGMKKILNEAFEVSRCYKADDSHMDQCYNDNPGFASLVIGRKEPELYKNGCTQRIRAFERNLLDETLSVSKLIDNGKNGTFIGTDDEGKRIHVTWTSKADNDVPQESQEKPKVTQADYGHILDVPFKSFRKKRKRAPRYKKSKAPSHKNLPHVKEVSQEVSVLTVDNENPLINSSQDTADEIAKETISPSSPKSPFDGIEMGTTQSGCANGTGSCVEFLKPCCLHKETNEHKASINKADLTRHESLLVEFKAPVCKTDSKQDKESEGKMDAKVSDLDDGSPPVSNRFLKYTFQRKRKKDSSSSPEDNSSLKRNTAEKQNCSSEPQNSILITESSRDSRRLAQVARQVGTSP